MTERVKCPYEPQARRGACERDGCNHYAANRSRICRCCMAQLPAEESNKLTLLCTLGQDLGIIDAAMSAALAKLQTIPRRIIVSKRLKPGMWR